MGKSKRQTAAENLSAKAEADRSALQATIQAGTPESKAVNARVASRRTAIDDGNLDGAPDFIGNQANQAEINRKREAEFNAAPTGLMAIGKKFANPNQIALQTKILKDRQARDAAGNLEGQWQGYINDTNNLENGVVGRQDNINLSLMGDAGSRAVQQQQIANQIASQRMNMWAGLAGAGIGGLTSIIKPISI